MKFKYNVSIRGNVEYASMSALTSAINENIGLIPNFTLNQKSIEVWQGNGVPVLQESGLYRYTLQLGGVILADNEATIDAIIAGFCTQYPEFVLTWSSCNVFQGAWGEPQEFNDDGTAYYPEPEVTEEPEAGEAADPVVEEIVDPTAATEGDNA